MVLTLITTIYIINIYIIMGTEVIFRKEIIYDKVKLSQVINMVSSTRR